MKKQITKVSLILPVLFFSFGIFDYFVYAKTNIKEKNSSETFKYVIEPNIEKAENVLQSKLLADAKALKKRARLVKNDRYFITGYQAVRGQTDSTPHLAAWNDNILGAINVAAVVQDSHFRRGTCIQIAGLKETYIVLDHFNKKYNGRKKIDVLVKTKKEAHRITGRRNIKILPPGSCGLKRIVDGETREEKFFRRKRFKL